MECRWDAMIAQHTVNVCPYCGKDDRIQRARAFAHPRLAAPIYTETPKPMWREPNKSLRLLLASLLALSLCLLVTGAAQVDGALVVGFISGGGVAFISALILAGVMRTRRKTALSQHASTIDIWERRVNMERRRWQIAHARWENDLFYCHRDDVVFFRGSPAVRPDQMHALLY
jgi:hypothetical protein